MSLSLMDLQLKHIKDSDYKVEEFFLESMGKLPLSLAFAISVYLDENLPELKENLLTTHILGGRIIHKDSPFYFVVEILYDEDKVLTFTDIMEIDMDEYLDLMNLNMYIKTNGQSRATTTNYG